MTEERPEWNEHFLEGLRLFDEGEYFEAHDEMEELWLDEVGAVKKAVQALIQVSIGLYHRQRLNLRGAQKLFHTAAEIFAELEDDVMDLEIRDLERRARRLEEEAREQFQAEQPTYDLSLVPCFAEYRARQAIRRGR